MTHTVIPSLVLLLIVAAAARFFSKRPSRLVWLANGSLVNTTHWGEFTKLADPTVTFSQRYLVCSRDQLGNGEQYIQPYVANTVPFGVVRDMTPTTDTAPSSYPLHGVMLGMNQDTERMVAGGTINIDDYVYPAVGGTILSLKTAANGTYYVVGKAAVGTVTGSGDSIEVIPSFPFQVTVA